MDLENSLPRGELSKKCKERKLGCLLLISPSPACRVSIRRDTRNCVSILPIFYSVLETRCVPRQNIERDDLAVILVTRDNCEDPQCSEQLQNFLRRR